jgi:hypothetical protein
MVPDNVVYRWEAAYSRYGHAARAAATSVAGDRNAALEMAAASREVAVAWCEIEAIGDAPWWTLAALSAAAQAFEFQARDWSVRAAHGWSVERDRPSRPDVWPPSQAFPPPPTAAEG